MFRKTWNRKYRLIGLVLGPDRVRAESQVSARNLGFSLVLFLDISNILHVWISGVTMKFSREIIEGRS